MRKFGKTKKPSASPDPDIVIKDSALSVSEASVGAATADVWAKMDAAEAEASDNVAGKKSKRKNAAARRRRRDYIFVAVLLAYPVLQFAITWIFVNIGSIKMAFERTNIYGETEFVWFDQFIKVVKDIFMTERNTTGVPWLNDNSVILINSLGYAVITIFISLPLSLLFAYFLDKKMPLANVFRVIFFLPNIIPVVALVMSFNMPFKYLVDGMYGSWPKSQMWVYLYCIWAGLGYNVVLLSGAIGRIPKEMYESAQLDGAGYFTEFTKITIPLVWPTIVTLVVVGLTNVLTLYLQPYLLGGENVAHIYSISMEIFVTTSEFNPIKYSEMAAKGLLFSVIWAPIVLLVRNRMSKKYDGIDF